MTFAWYGHLKFREFLPVYRFNGRYPTPEVAKRFSKPLKRCAPQKIHSGVLSPSCRDFLQPVFVMQPSKNGFRNDSAIFWNTVALLFQLGFR
jgi:hypothetical protein